MRAQLINEKFTEGGDPIQDMNIGNPEKFILPDLVKKLNELGIGAGWERDRNMGDGFWYFNIDFRTDYEEGMDVSLSYVTDKAAKESEEGWKGGFALYNEDGDEELIPITHDANRVIKALLKVKYESKKNIAIQIRNLEKTLDTLKNVEKYM